MIGLGTIWSGHRSFCLKGHGSMFDISVLDYIDYPDGVVLIGGYWKKQGQARSNFGNWSLVGFCVSLRSLLSAFFW